MWQEWLPAKHRDAGRRVERHRLGELKYTAGTTYNYDLDPPDGSGDWCAQSGGVLVPLIIIPLWDAELAAAEVRRNAERG